MAHDDNVLETAIWLAAGSAAGYAALRWVVAPRLGTSAATTAPTSSSRAAPAPSKVPAPRTRSSGSSGFMTPIDPYAAPAATPLVRPSTAVDGPITQPYQLDAPTTSSPSPAVAFATSSRVRRFDPLFERYRGNLPIEYVRALVERESDGLASVRAGQAIGLMQIVPVVLDDYNKRHGTAYTSDHLSQPATNVAIGCELLRLIVASYRRNHPRIRTLQTDWSSRDFIELLTFGWNAGFSEAGGVGRVATYLEKLGAVDITIDEVSAHAHLAGASKHLSNPAKVAWCKSVAALYLRERELCRPLFVST